MSYGNNVTTVNLDRSGAMLIIGEDLDNTSGQGGNGVGKTTILNAITCALYDRPISNITKDNLINNINKKNMELIIEFTAPNKKHYKVRRTRKMKDDKSGSGVFVFEDGKDITPDNVSNTNKLIEQILGIPYELFVRIVVFSATYAPFLNLPVKSASGANQSDIIEELFGLTMLSEKAEVLKDVIKETEALMKLQQTKLDAAQGEQQRHQDQIRVAKGRILNWEEQRKRQIADIEQKLKKIEHVDFEKEKQYHTQLVEYKSELTLTQTNLRNARQHLNEAVKSLTKNEQDIEHLKDATCPFCKQHYADANHKLSEHEGISSELAEMVDQLQQEIKLLQDREDVLVKTISEIKNNITVDNIKELEQIKNDSSVMLANIKHLEESENPFLIQLEDLESVKFDPIDYNEINLLNTKIEHQKFLLKLLTKKDSFVRKALLNKNIPFVNSRLQYYLSLLGLPHTVEFTHEMTASISKFGQSLDFGNLSAGQQARVNIALAFAFRDVLQSLHTKINICILDEVLDIGLDNLGVQATIRMLKQKAHDEQLCLYVISHRDEIDRLFDNVLKIQMSQGFSYIKED